jgi:hypothetical protein
VYSHFSAVVATVRVTSALPEASKERAAEGFTDNSSAGVTFWQDTTVAANIVAAISKDLIFIKKLKVSELIYIVV